MRCGALVLATLSLPHRRATIHNATDEIEIVDRENFLDKVLPYHQEKHLTNFAKINSTQYSIDGAISAAVLALRNFDKFHFPSSAESSIVVSEPSMTLAQQLEESWTQIVLLYIHSSRTVAVSRHLSTCFLWMKPWIAGSRQCPSQSMSTLMPTSGLTGL